MSAIKFLCPSCSQHIACGPEYAGLTVDCPSCRTAMIVPGGAEATPPPAVTGFSCPGCAAPMEADAIICTACGFNLRTGKKIQPQVMNVAVPKRASSGLGMGNIIAIAVFVMLAVLFGLAFTSDSMATIFQISAAVFVVIVHIMAVVSAFQDGAGTGVMTLFCFPYAIYYVYARSENPTLKVLYSIALLIRIAGFAVPMGRD
jgi:hypothetical protein